MYAKRIATGAPSGAGWGSIKKHLAGPANDDGVSILDGIGRCLGEGLGVCQKSTTKKRAHVVGGRGCSE